MTFSVLLLANSFAQNSFGLEDNDQIFELGSHGIKSPGNPATGHFSHPQFIAVGDDGSIYVSDLGNKRIQKFSSDGEYITEWGSSGRYFGEFYYPSGIAVSADSVFVADREQNRIQKFSLDGEFVTAWGQKGIYEGEFFFPNGIAVNNDVVYVVDTGNQRVQMFSTDGEFISSFGSSGLGDGEFLTAVGIDIDADGNVYVTDRGSSNIEKFDANGEFIESFTFYGSHTVFSPETIAVDPTGSMFIVNSATDRILHLSQDSNPKLNIFDQIGEFPNSFDYVTDIAIGINGELLIVDSTNHTIKFFETEFYVEPVIVDSVEIPDEISNEIIVDLSDDKIMPVIIAPPSLTVEATDMLTTVLFGDAIATDESGIQTIINNAPEIFTPGVSTILWIAFDNAGNSSKTTQIITVDTCGHTYSDYNIIEGTEGNDVIQGTLGDDLIFGLAGNDIISGGDGNDCIFGGYGDDIISGGDGSDTIKGNSGHDILKGESGSDVIYSNSGSDVIDGGDDTDGCYSPTDSTTDLLLNCEN